MVNVLSTNQNINRYHYAAFFLILIAVATLYFESYVSLIKVWYVTQTYQHGFLILPIVLFLVWRKRSQIANAEASVSWAGLLLVILLSIFWVIAEISGIQAIQHIVIISIIPALVLCCLGYQIARIIIFPLFYMFFAIPVGESLVYPLQQITAHIVISSLKLTSIPMYVEGQFIHIPAGTFHVAEACSGINFLFAFFTLSLLYVYLEYKKTYKRIVFLVFALIVPILANGLRAFLTVLAGHWISMEFAGGADHIIFGWQFFGLVMFLMFWIGTRWRDKENDQHA